MTGVVDPGASTPPGKDVTTGVGLRFAAGFAAVILLSLLVALVALDRSGVAARTLPATTSEIVVVDDARGLLAAWNEAGLHGVVLVDVTRDLGYTPVTIWTELPSRSAKWPVTLLNLQTMFDKGVDRQNMVWVASKTGIARSVTYVLNSADLAQNVRLGRENGYPGISSDGLSITANDDGYLRRIGARFPDRVPESAVLNIDASYFVSGTAEGLAKQLDESAVSYRYVTLDRANDATSVPETARVELDRMAEILRRRELK